MLFQLEAKVILVGIAFVVAGGLLSFVEWKKLIGIIRNGIEIQESISQRGYDDIK